MCLVPDAPDVKIPEGQYLRNPFLDNGSNENRALAGNRMGRSALMIPMDSAGAGVVGFGFRKAGAGAAKSFSPAGNMGSGLGIPTSGAMNFPSMRGRTTPLPAAGTNPNSYGPNLQVH